MMPRAASLSTSRRAAVLPSHRPAPRRAPRRAEAASAPVGRCALEGGHPTLPCMIERTEAVGAAPDARSPPAAAGGDSALDKLRLVSKVVADSADIDSVARFSSEDVTTNPSLLLKAATMPEYAHLVDEAAAADVPHGYPLPRPMSYAADYLAVAFGCEMLRLVPGRVSTECDASIAHDAEATARKGRDLVSLYAARGVDAREKVYIKIAATPEGIEACRELEEAGIRTNMTLIFSHEQAVACAEAGASLISPFVGRVSDWYKAKNGHEYLPHEDPGVLSVKRIYHEFKTMGATTEVMAASFRTIGQIRELAGLDALTISPALLAELAADASPLELKLWPDEVHKLDVDPSALEQVKVGHHWEREAHLVDFMATEKLAEGVESFVKDQLALEEMLAERKAKAGY